jgi:hypothetical protein
MELLGLLTESPWAKSVDFSARKKAMPYGDCGSAGSVAVKETRDRWMYLSEKRRR